MRLAKMTLLALVARASLAWAEPSPFMYVDLHKKGHGMFSVFCYVAGALYDYENHDYAGIEVDFGEKGFYYDPEYGPNWWEYYCEPILIGHPEDGNIKNVNELYSDYAHFVDGQMDRQTAYQLIQKYIKIKDHVQMKIEEFIAENFNGHHVIGIHYRGTDKKGEAPRVPFEDVLDTVNRYVTENNIQDFRVFVASDEQQFIQFMQESYPGQVLVYSTIHSVDGKCLHRNTSNIYLHGEEALIDCILLSRGDFLIRTSSNLSRWSTFFNPTIPSLELNQRYERGVGPPKPPKPPKPVKPPKPQKLPKIPKVKKQKNESTL